MKYLCTLFSIAILNLTFSQIVFEEEIYPPSNPGDIKLQDVIITEVNDTGKIITGGYFYQDMRVKNADNYWGVLTKTDTSGNAIYNLIYQANQNDSIFNTKIFDVEEYEGGYIAVGSVQDNQNVGSSLDGGSDVFLLQVNTNGSVINAKNIDFDEGFDEAYAIYPNEDRSRFFVCGYSTQNDTLQEGFVMRIKSNLAVDWVTRVDLRFDVEEPELTTLYDVVLDSNGSYVWAVGGITTDNSTVYDGLIVKLNTNGTFLNAYNFDTDNTTEIFYGVDADGEDNLAIAGKYSTGSNTHMAAWKYAISTNTMANSIALPEGSSGNYEASIGYDIKVRDPGGTKEYVIVGETDPSSGTKKGYFNKLNANFVPTSRADFSVTGEARLNSIDTYDDNLEFLAMTGYNKPSSSFLQGYVIKSNINGDTECNELIDTNVISLDHTPDTLLWDTILTRTIYTPDIEVDTLLDSLVCLDTLSAPEGKSQVNLDIKNYTQNSILVYPNPVKSGGRLNLRFDESILIKSVRIETMSGQLIYEQKSQFNGFIPIDERYSKGLYILRIELETNGDNQQQIFKILVE